MSIMCPEGIGDGLSLLVSSLLLIPLPEDEVEGKREKENKEERPQKNSKDRKTEKEVIDPYYPWKRSLKSSKV